MRPLSISESAKKIFPIHTKRELIDIKDTDFPGVSAVIVTKIDVDWIKKINEMHFDLPIIVVIEEGNEEAKNNFSKFNSTVVIDSSKKNIELYSIYTVNYCCKDRKNRWNSLSKLGVSISCPMASRISRRLQKRPPSSSSCEGWMGPS